MVRTQSYGRYGTLFNLLPVSTYDPIIITSDSEHTIKMVYLGSVSVKEVSEE
jgi:hypothetical protein